MANQPPSSQSQPAHLFPRRRLRPYDGMAVTADVWEQAHSFHEQALRAHTRSLHGTGILSGLEVVASDPPERIIYILPGAAVDPAGQVIVLPEPVAYDIGGDVDGPLFLFIAHRQGSSGNAGDETSPTYSEEQYLITANPVIPDRPAVELARFVCESRTSQLVDAANPLRPGINEIDLRHRAMLPAPTEQPVSVGTAYLGEGPLPPHGSGLARISRELAHTSRLNLVIDDDIQLGPKATRYNLLYLVGQGSFKISATITRGLQGYLQRGGMLFFETCDAEAQADALNLCGQLGIGLKSITSGHPLLSSPYLFDAPPDGSRTGEVLVGQTTEGQMQVVLSSKGYGSLWAGRGGETPDSAPSREQMRAAVEFAANLLHFGLDQRPQA